MLLINLSMLGSDRIKQACQEALRRNYSGRLAFVPVFESKDQLINFVRILDEVYRTPCARPPQLLPQVFIDNQAQPIRINTQETKEIGTVPESEAYKVEQFKDSMVVGFSSEHFLALMSDDCFKGTNHALPYLKSKFGDGFLADVPELGAIQSLACVPGSYHKDLHSMTALGWSVYYGHLQLIDEFALQSSLEREKNKAMLIQCVVMDRLGRQCWHEVLIRCAHIGFVPENILPRLFDSSVPEILSRPPSIDKFRSYAEKREAAWTGLLSITPEDHMHPAVLMSKALLASGEKPTSCWLPYAENLISTILQQRPLVLRNIALRFLPKEKVSYDAFSLAKLKLGSTAKPHDQLLVLAEMLPTKEQLEAAMFSISQYAAKNFGWEEPGIVTNIVKTAFLPDLSFVLKGGRVSVALPKKEKLDDSGLGTDPKISVVR